MSRKTVSPGTQGVASGGGFTPRSQATGFLVSLKSLFWPAGTQPSADRRTPQDMPAGSLRTLSAMPRAARARVVFPAAGPRKLNVTEESTLEAHPLRRVAGSAGRWKKRLDEAKRTWSKLSADELVETDGHVQKLVCLVQGRYGLSYDVAEQQVRSFLGPRDAGG